MTTTFICHKNDRNELSNNSEQMKKPICKWNLTPEDSDDCDKSDHTLTPDVDIISCNVVSCNYSHTQSYNKDNDNNDSGDYLTPTLSNFMDMSVEIHGKDIIEEISFYKHKLCEYKRILSNDYNISPVTVKRWMNIL